MSSMKSMRSTIPASQKAISMSSSISARSSGMFGSNAVKLSASFALGARRAIASSVAVTRSTTDDTDCARARSRRGA
jgi:hypothetical protein